MTVWMLHLALSPEEEQAIASREVLPLPFETVPDLSKVVSRSDLKYLLHVLHRDDPPEAIGHRLDHLWHIYSGLQEEDIIGVPLPARREVAIAEVTDRYRYVEGVKEAHVIPVKWHGRRAPFSAFRKSKNVLEGKPGSMVEVAAVEARTAIRDRLPYKYNRFVAIKWLLVIFIGLHVVKLAHRLISGQ